MARAGAVLVLTAMVGLVFLGLTQPTDEPPGYQSALNLGAKPAEASWYFTCRTDRNKHRHPLRGVTHIWKDIIVLHRGGNRYVRGTWVTWDWGLERVTASDRRTYGPC